MKNNFRILVAFFILHSLSVSFCLASNLLNYPADNPSKEILNIRLNPSDFSSNSVFCGQNTIRHPSYAGWIRVAAPQTWDDYTPGLAESWKEGAAYYTCQYGFFQVSNEAQFGVENTIEARLGGDSDPVTKQNLTGFSGQVIGDRTVTWHSEMEKQYGTFDKGPNNQPFPNEYAGLAFAKERYAFAIHASAKKAEGQIDRTIMEALGEKVLKKINVSNSFFYLEESLSQLITHQGILHSLQVKVEKFSKHYLKGEYNTALNNMNSFINELAAQRGKHVSEHAYQTLKTLADAIVTNTTSLL